MHDFDAWKQKYHPGWYLNSLEEDENLFEDYMAWKRKENDHGDNDVTTCIRSRCESNRDD